MRLALILGLGTILAIGAATDTLAEESSSISSMPVSVIVLEGPDSTEPAAPAPSPNPPDADSRDAVASVRVLPATGAGPDGAGSAPLALLAAAVTLGAIGGLSRRWHGAAGPRAE